MKKLFKQLHNLVAKNQLKQRFGKQDEVEHFVFITKKKESDVQFQGCYQNEELAKMLFAVANDNPEFLESMKQVTKEVEERKKAGHHSFELCLTENPFEDLAKILRPTPSRCEIVPFGGFGIDKSYQDEAKKVFADGGYTTDDHYGGIVAEFRRQSEERDKEMILRKKPFPILCSGTVYHETLPSDTIDVNDKKKKYFFFHDKEKKQIFTLTNENERKFAIDDKRKIYWMWRQ